MSDDHVKPKDVESAFGRCFGLYERQRLAREEIRKQWKAKAGNILDAHLLAVSASIGMVDRNNLKPAKTSKEISGRLSLTASFLQGIDLCEVTISEGMYVGAAALLKQEMETIAALQEFRSGNRNERRTPNVANVPGKMARLYGELNSVAHIADAKILSDIISTSISEELTGASIVPQFNGDWAFRYYGMHVVLILLNALEIDQLVTELYGSGKSELEERMIVKAFDILLQTGWLEIEQGRP